PRSCPPLQRSPASPAHRRSSCPPLSRSRSRSALRSLLQAGLLRYAVERAGRQVVRRLAGDGHAARFCHVLVLPMTAAGGNQKPAVIFDHPDCFAYLHPAPPASLARVGARAKRIALPPPPPHRLKADPHAVAGRLGEA